MAQACTSGVNECSGCGNCQDKAVHTCDCCENDIYLGNTFYWVDGMPYCEGCVRPEIAEFEI